MKYKHIFIISPPFYSHFSPLVVFGKSLKKLGVEVTIGCSSDFKERVLNEDLEFHEIDISKNKNTGKAEKTIQPNSEQERLEEFFESTRKGAIETLITQSNHRKADMLYDPHELIENIKMINEQLDVDLFVVDILSYSVTLSLYFLGLPFITFCPPHPRTISDKGDHYGVPNNWPSAIHAEDEKLKKLKEVSTTTQKEFTEVFNDIISRNKDIKEIDNAFSLVSEVATIYNYLDFYNDENKEINPYKIFMGHCFEKSDLEQGWINRINNYEKKIMITLGTFLSNRKDVLKKLIKGTRSAYPEALIIVSAGSNSENLKAYRSPDTIIESFIPQRALIPYMDIVVQHGGCNTFTETMHYGKKIILLPFSSDQFNIAYDVELNNLGQILDPNSFEENDLLEVFKNLEDMDCDRLKYWSHLYEQRGSDYAAKVLLGMD